MWDRIGTRWAARMMSCAAILAMPGWAEAVRVRGTVVDREGKPAAAAKVWAAKLGFLEPLEVREGTADSSGAFAIEVGPGDWAVFALRGKEGGRVGWGSIAKVADGKDPKPVKVRLGPPSMLKGRLLDAETGRPITRGQFALDDARRLTVDADGRFQAPGLAMTNHEAYPLCPGYERKRILFDTTGRPEAELELRLPRAGTVVGRVLGEDGKPVAGASVGLRTSGSIFSGAALWERCSDDGRFSYDGKPLGRTGRLSARAPGHLDQEREGVIVLDPSNPAEIAFTLRPDPTRRAASKPAAEVTGRRTVSGTIQGPDGKPVDSAVVRWGLLTSSDRIPETKTDASGGFRLEGVPGSADVLSVMAKGLAPSFPLVDSRGDPRLTIRLERGSTIRGRVVDDVGQPIEGVRVVPKVKNPRPRWIGSVYLDELQGETDREGRYTLEGMPGDVACDVVAEGWSAVRDRTLSASDESKNVVTLLGEGAIRGRVVDPTGSPVRNFRILVGIPKGVRSGDPVGGYFAGYGGPGLSFTRDDGEFLISGLTAGHLHRLTVITEKRGTGEVDRVKARSVRRLEPAEGLTIRLGFPHTLRVRVFGAGGKRVEGARVTVIENEGGRGFHWGISESSWTDSVTARAGADGWAAFPALAFGKGTAIVRARGFARAKVDWLKDEPELDVFVEPECKITGRVLDESGRPASATTVMLSWGEGEMMTVPVDEKDGRYVADGLRSGRYTLSVVPRVGQGRSTESVELATGQSLSKDLRIHIARPAAAGARD